MKLIVQTLTIKHVAHFCKVRVKVRKFNIRNFKYVHILINMCISHDSGE